jgi:hypothetical protein
MVIARRTKVQQDALTRECDGVPIGRDAIKTSTAAIFSNLVECICHFVIHILYFQARISSVVCFFVGLSGA